MLREHPRREIDNHGARSGYLQYMQSIMYIVFQLNKGHPTSAMACISKYIRYPHTHFHLDPGFQCCPCWKLGLSTSSRCSVSVMDSTIAITLGSLQTVLAQHMGLPRGLSRKSWRRRRLACVGGLLVPICQVTHQTRGFCLARQAHGYQ